MRVTLECGPSVASQQLSDSLNRALREKVAKSDEFDQFRVLEIVWKAKMLAALSQSPR